MPDDEALNRLPKSGSKAHEIARGGFNRGIPKNKEVPLLFRRSQRRQTICGVTFGDATFAICSDEDENDEA